MQKTAEVGPHRGHLRLLKHDLGQPDPVGITGVLPGEIMAAATDLPGNHQVGKLRRLCGCGLLQDDQATATG
jgi:hypothetical protein